MEMTFSKLESEKLSTKNLAMRAFKSMKKSDIITMQKMIPYCKFVGANLMSYFVPEKGTETEFLSEINRLIGNYISEK